MSPARTPTEGQAILAEIRGLKGSLDRLEDKVTRTAARVDEVVNNVSEHGAQIETLVDKVDASDLRARGSRSEIIGMIQRGHVEVQDSVRTDFSEIKSKYEALESKVSRLTPSVASASEAGAERGAERGVERSKPSLRAETVKYAGLISGSGVMAAVVTHPVETLKWLKWAAGIVAGSHVPGVD